MLSHPQLRRQLESLTGKKAPISFYDKIEKVTVSDDTIYVLVRVLKVREMARETRITASGQRIFVYQQHSDSFGHKYWRFNAAQDFTVWDADFVETSFDVRRPVLTPDEHREKRNYEADCYRPGSASAPMDNYSRTMLDPTGSSDKSTPRMERHWSK